jgi:putative membrane protein
MTWREKLNALTVLITAYLVKVFSDKKNLFRFAFAGAAIVIVSQFMPAVIIASFWVALLLILVMISLLLSAQPALVYLKIPYSILTFGIYLWLSNSIILLLLDLLLWYFETTTWWWVVLFALVQAVINSLIETLIQEE